MPKSQQSPFLGKEEQGPRDRTACTNGTTEEKSSVRRFLPTAYRGEGPSDKKKERNGPSPHTSSETHAVSPSLGRDHRVQPELKGGHGEGKLASHGNNEGWKDKKVAWQSTRHGTSLLTKRGISNNLFSLGKEVLYNHPSKHRLMARRGRREKKEERTEE